MSRRKLLTFAAATWLLGGGALGCGDDGEETLGPGGGAPGCEPPEVALGDGSCIRPGVLPEGCAEGFVHDGLYGCEPILPPEPCPYGLMAVPGETECRPVMPCGEGRWGDLPVDGATVYVDAAYTGGSSDGTEDSPYTTLSDGIADASPGALVAVAAGTYEEDVVIQKPVRLWGVCPDLVRLVGQGGNVGALLVLAGASGAEVGGLAATAESSPIAVGVSGAEDVTLERLWLHDAGGRGLNFEGSAGPTSVTIRHTLVENNHEVGLFVGASVATVESSVIRGTQPRPGSQAGGGGIAIQWEPFAGAPPTVVSNSLIEGNHEVGVLVGGSAVTIEATVVRDTLPRPSDQTAGRGINLQPDPSTSTPATVTVSASVIERSHEAGVLVGGSLATIAGTVVRDTLPQPSDQTGGRGINVQIDPFTAAPSTVTLSASLVARTHDLGVYVSGSAVAIDGTVVQDTLPRQSDQTAGRGVGIEVDAHTGTPSTVTLSASLVERSYDVGIFVVGAAATINATVVRGTRPRLSDDLFGDGIAIFSDVAPATATLSGCVSEDNARAGLASFGGDVAVAGLRLRCNAFDLAGENSGEQPFVYTDLGGNLCGCDASGDCKTISAGLVPPEAIGVGIPAPE